MQEQAKKEQPSVNFLEKMRILQKQFAEAHQAHLEGVNLDELGGKDESMYNLVETNSLFADDLKLKDDVRQALDAYGADVKASGSASRFIFLQYLRNEITAREAEAYLAKARGKTANQ